MSLFIIHNIKINYANERSFAQLRTQRLAIL